MKICILHRYPISLIRGTNPSFPLFIDKLLMVGNEIFFVSFKEPDKNLYVGKIHYNEINACFNRANSLDKLIKSLWFTLYTPFLIRKLHRKENFSLVYCDDSFPFYGFLIKKIAKIKTIIRLGDLQSAYIFADGNMFLKLIFKLVFSIEKIMWNSADKVVVISKAFKDFLLRNGMLEEQIECVQECIDLEMFKPKEEKGTIRKKYGIGDAPLVMFHGLIAKMKGLDTLLKAISIVLKVKPDIKLMIIGDGSDLKRLKIFASKLGIDKSVIFTGWVHFNQIPEYLSECDIGIPSRSANLGNNLVVTTALLQYCAMEKPIIAPRLTAIENFFQKDQPGLCFVPDNQYDLADKILKMMDTNIQIQKRYGILGRTLAKRSFNINLVAQKMVEILSK